MARICPAWPDATASGFMMAKVCSIGMENCIRCNASQTLEAALDFFSDIGWRGTNRDARRGHGSHFVFGLSGPTGNDRAGMTHAAAGRCSLTGDESNYRLLDMLCYVGRSRLFRVPADLTDHDNCMRVEVGVEKLNRVHERRTDDRIAADSDTGGLADPKLRELADGFISKSSRARNHANISLPMNVSRHNPDLAFSG